MKRLRTIHRRRALLTLVATFGAQAGLGYVAVPASAQTILEAENASWGGACGTEGQQQSTQAASGGATVVFLGSSGCAVTFSAAQASTVQEVRWFGGGAAGQVCGTFAVVQSGTELARTAQSCSTGGASPNDFKTPAFPANTVQAGSFQIVWYPASQNWYDAYLDWSAIAPTGTTRREAEATSFGGTCGTEGQQQTSQTTGSGATVVYLGSEGCALTFNVSSAASVKQVRWFGGGSAGAVCGTFGAVQNGVEVARTAQSCSTGGANPDDFKAPVFPANSISSGSFQLVWHPADQLWHDAYVDWVETAASSGGGGGNNPPTACINTPSISGRSVSVSSCSTDPNGDALTLTWNWGDGTANSTGASASHVYACPGSTYTITLTANDGRGGTHSTTRNARAVDADSDGDGLVNCLETGTYGTNAFDSDSDDDGLLDGPELTQWNAKGANAWNTNYDRWDTATNNLLKRDADGDGISDSVEFNRPTSVFGNCASIGGRNECPDAGVRDLYLQVNWMNHPGTTCYVFWTCGAHNHRPSDAEVQTFRDNFATRNAGLAVRDQLRVHVYMGAAGDGNGATQHADAISFDRVTGANNDLYDFKDAHFAADRLGVFHFVLFAHGTTAGGGVLGEAEVFGDDVAIYHANMATSVDVVATWMQEVGHNIVGMRFVSCVSPGMSRYSNPAATNLDFHDSDTTSGDPRFGYNPLFDQGLANGSCTSRDQVQDVFGHASDANDAMSYGYVATSVATTFTATTWNALKPGTALDARRLGFDLDSGTGHDHDHDHDHDGLPDVLTAVTPLVPRL